MPRGRDVMGEAEVASQKCRADSGIGVAIERLPNHTR